MAGTVSKGVIERFTSRLRFPQLFFVLAALFVADLIILDPIPFADEVMLGLLTALVGRFRKPRRERDAEERPPMKNVTPPSASG